MTVTAFNVSLCEDQAPQLARLSPEGSRCESPDVLCPTLIMKVHVMLLLSNFNEPTELK